jgi:hypothetical protein
MPEISTRDLRGTLGLPIPVKLVSHHYGHMTSTVLVGRKKAKKYKNTKKTQLDYKNSTLINEYFVETIILFSDYCI